MDANKTYTMDLHVAAGQGDLEAVDGLIQTGCEVEAQRQDGSTSLHLAAEHGHLEVVDRLIQAGCNVKAVTVEGITSLHLAAEHGHLEVVDKLILARCNVNAATVEGIQCLHLAAEHGHPEVVDRLIQAECDVDAVTAEGITSLHLAAEHGHLEVVDRLIQAECNWDATTQDGSTSLHKAASSGNVKVVEKLVAHGCNLDAVTKAGLSVLHEAVNGGNPKIVSCLIQAGCMISTGSKESKGDDAWLTKQLILHHSKSYGLKSSPLHLAVSFSRLDILEHSLTVPKSHSVNCTDSRGRTPLHLAAKMNEYVEVLLKNGADPMSHTDNQWLPLHFAVHGNDADALQSLIQVTNDINDVTSEGSTALHYAVERNDSEFTDILLKVKGIKMDVMDKHGHTPLHIAVHHSYGSIIEGLAGRGANVNQYTTKTSKNQEIPAYNETALHIAARRGDDKVVSILINHGADVDKWTSDCYKALHLASKNRHDSIVRILMSAGDLNSKDQTGRSALHIALTSQLEKLVELLLDSHVTTNEPAADGRLPIHVAKVTGLESDKIMKKLLLATNDVNVTNWKNGWTALHYAAEMGDTDYIDILVRNSANVNSVSHSKETPLHVACRYGHIDAVSRLVQLGASLDACNEDILLKEKGINLDSIDNHGHTLLHIAAHHGHGRIVERLAELGANVDQYVIEPIKNEITYTETALHIAARRGDDEVVSILIKHGADVNKWTSDCYLALHLASMKGHDSVVNILMSAGDLNSKDQSGRSALHIALISQLEKLVELLLDSEIATNEPTADGRLPIHVARVAGLESNGMILKLLQATNDINMANQKNGWTALHYAAEMNDTDYINILVQNSAKVNSVSHSEKTPLHVACIYGHIDAVSSLIQLGAQLDACDEESRNPLHCAMKDRQELIIHLMKQFIQKGLQPFHTLIEAGHIGAIRQLLDGENNSQVIRQTDADGLTSVSKACKYGQYEILILLLDKNADVMIRDNAGRTPMHIVIESFCSHLRHITTPRNSTICPETEIYKRIMQLLHEHNKSLISMEDRNGEIPLHVMASHTNMHAISEGLYEKHYGEESDWFYSMKILADISDTDDGLATTNEDLINARNKETQTALHKACATFTGENMKLLISKSNINVKDADGWMPLDLAIHHANTDAICCLTKAHSNSSEDISTVLKEAHVRLIDRLKDIDSVDDLVRCGVPKLTNSDVLRSWYEALVSADIGFKMTWFHDLGATLPEDPGYTFAPVKPHRSVKTAHTQRCYPIKSTPRGHAIIVNMNEFECRLEKLFRQLDFAIQDVIPESSTADSGVSDMISRAQRELARWQAIQNKEAVIQMLKNYPESHAYLHKITDKLDKKVNHWREMTEQRIQASQALPGPETGQTYSSSVIRNLLDQVGNDLSTWDTNPERVSFQQNRKGSEIDVERMQKLFLQLQFEVSYWSNCTEEQLKANIEEERLSDEHKASDAFVFVMMSHGTRNYIQTSDKQYLSIEKDIEDKFDGVNCPDLEGKPKLFFIQACQEEKAQKAAAENKSVDEVSVERHRKSDVIEIYTTYPAYVAVRNFHHGSWGVEEFVFICEMFAHKYDLLDLHTKMNQLLIKRMCEYTGLQQVSQLRNSLTKRFYLTPR